MGYGVDRIMITSGTLEDLQESLSLLREYPEFKMATTVGVHPTRCMELENDATMLGKLKELYDSNHGNIAAVGEFGLDYDRLQFCPKEIQLKWFHKQFELVDHIKKPLFLHMRACAEDFMTVIREHRHRFSDGVVHSFTGNAQEAAMVLKENLFIGINGCSLKSCETVEAIKHIPMDRLMVESDAPWCGIRKSHAGYQYVKSLPASLVKEKYQQNVPVNSRNEPWATRQCLEAIASIKEIQVEEAASIVYENTCRIFKI